MTDFAKDPGHLPYAPGEPRLGPDLAHWEAFLLRQLAFARLMYPEQYPTPPVDT